MTTYKQLIARNTLRGLWDVWQNRVLWNGTQEQFITHLQGLVTDPAKVTDRVKFCANCGIPFDKEVLHEHGDLWVCDPCWNAYYRPCGECGHRGPGEGRTGALVAVGGVLVCSVCITNHYTQCRNCGQFYDAAHLNDHRHGSDDCCASPALEFTFPFEGGSIQQDERVTLSLDAGTLPRSGTRAIEMMLAKEAQKLGNIYHGDTRAGRMYQVACHVFRTGGVGSEVKTKEGNLATRVKRYAYKNYALKIDPPILTQIGNLVSQHSRGGDLLVAVTRDVNLPPAEFGNHNSCWWTDYKASRCALKSNGGMALRSFDPTTGRVLGRVWVHPLTLGVDKRVAPTFRTDSGLYFVLNGYGNLQETVGPKAVQQMVGAEHFSRVHVEIDRYYVNNSSGYLVGAVEDIASVTRLGLNLSLQEHSHLYEREQEPTPPKPTRKSVKFIAA